MLSSVPAPRCHDIKQLLHEVVEVTSLLDKWESFLKICEVCVQLGAIGLNHGIQPSAATKKPITCSAADTNFRTICYTSFQMK